MASLNSLEILWRGLTPTLLRHDGTEYPGGTVIKNYLPPYSKKHPEIVLFADNARGFSEVGNSHDWIDSFTLECFSESAVREIRSDIAAEVNAGLFVLEVPHFSGDVDRYAIRFYDAPFTRLYPRRQGFTPVFSADISEIDVYG